MVKDLPYFDGIEHLTKNTLQGPKPLNSLFPNTPGVYFVTCGDCLAHIGKATKLRDRLRKLRNLDKHDGSRKVLAASFVTKCEPLIRWIECGSSKEAEDLEHKLHLGFGDSPYPSPKYDNCNKGEVLQRTLEKHVDPDSWAAGYIEAMFIGGENMKYLWDDPRMQGIWTKVGRPVGPWRTIK